MTDKTLDEKTLKQWVGKSENFTETLDAAQAKLMQATFDQNTTLENGNPLPPLWHWVYFLSGAPMSQLGRDGHPKLGGFLPPVALPRRMWAGGRFEFDEPIMLGESITKQSTIKNVMVKSGRSGALCFVTVAHSYRGEDKRVRFIEEHDIVYREDPSDNAPAPTPPEAPGGSIYQETIVPSAVQLFRYSALTFNSHRIHYDREYCTDVEGYPGLVFHGPLTAIILANLAEAQTADKSLKTFNFRAASPLFDTAPFTVHTDGQNTFWAETPEGKLAMKATATLT